LVGLVLIDEPHAVEGYYGGVVAAPVFSTVLQGALRLLQIAPDDPGAQLPSMPLSPMPSLPDNEPLPPQTVASGDGDSGNGKVLARVGGAP